MVLYAYEAEWQRTHDIEHKASSSIGFVGVIFSLTIVTLSTILVSTDEVARDKIFFSSIFSLIGILVILAFMIVSVYFGIMALSVKEWKFPIADKFLEYCKNEPKEDEELLEAIFANYENNILENS
jgi:magnesium-transporting ATPase (P-type)